VIGDGVRNGELADRPVAIFSISDGPEGAAFFADPEAAEEDRLTFEFDGAN
jgi:hypothetical protein